jgi:hypothetical protein
MRRLLNLFPHEDIGWKDIGETFIRFTILKTPWFRVYVHNLIAKGAHPQCHSHPWSFIAIILSGGYNEYTKESGWVWRRPGSILYRPSSWTHNVTTSGMWSLVLTGPKTHAWGFHDC